ncbi:hypothetical protein ACQJBY_062258 [Aegilops geniculata]
MAELASGAVSSLLGVIRNEALLLGRVRQDVQFIREEMESMKSFLAHLERMAPEGGDYDELIRPWMNQVRLLARDCNNCMDLYLSRSSRDIHRARGGLWRCAWWVPWFVQMMAAQHRTAIQLRSLRDRVRDIGEWRLRYNVEFPAKWTGAGQLPEGTELAVPASMLPLMHVAASRDNEEDSDDHSRPRGAFLEPRSLEDKLADWMKNVVRRHSANEKSIPSVAVVAPDKEETLGIAREASAMWKKHCSRGRTVSVDIPAVHFYFQPLITQDILYYILRELQSDEPQPQQLEGQARVKEELDIDNGGKRAIWLEKKMLVGEIMENIKVLEVCKKIAEIMDAIGKMKVSQLQLNLEELSHDQLDLLESARNEPLGVLLRALWLLKLKHAKGVPATKHSQERKGATRPHEDIIRETAKKVREHMRDEASTNTNTIRLKEAQYEHILRKVFPPVTLRKTSQILPQDSQQATTTGTIVENQFKEMICKILHELQEKTSVKELDTVELHDDTSNQDCIQEALIEVVIKKVNDIQLKINEQVAIKGIMDRINNCLKRRGEKMLLVILKLDHDYISGWEETRNAFSIMGCIAGALLLTTTVNFKRAKEYCYPLREPIDNSLFGLYRDTVLEITNQQTKGDQSSILIDILDKCKSQEFCMKIFVHALYAKPKRTNKELIRLNNTLQASENTLDDIAMKMFRFCYNDLPKEYKSCLLYLAIFPPRQRIRRSTLIGRWITDGLITNEYWLSSVHRANRCFDVLLDRWLVYPADIAAAGQVKSCVVGDLVHGFITDIAMTQRIVQIRLSHHLARHFSIVNNLNLHSSDKIDRFFQKLPEESSGASLIKVLDLEGCQCFGGRNQSYLKDICSKMLLLKYLSLRGTNVNQLPSEINNLRELEVLDIRGTDMPANATVNVLLLKLNRLLAGRVVLNSRASSTEISSLEVPEKIEKMLSMEVLSNVKARKRQDMKDIGKLWQLRKLGVVIQYKEPHLRNFLRAISDLHECLKSLSITLPNIEDNKEIRDWVLEHYKNSPKLLESLSITGSTQTVQLVRLLTRDIDQLQLRKVTLSGTRLYQPDLKVLAKLPKLICLRLRDNAYIDSNLTFNNDEFENLKCFLIEGSNITVLSFGGGAHKLEKIILCSTAGLSISGVEDLLELKDVELKNSNKLSLFDKAKKISKVTLWHTSLSQYEVEILAKIPNMRNLVLKDIFCVQSQLILYKDDFPKLNLLTVDFSVTPKTIITDGSAPKLEKIIWSFTKDTVGTLSISGTDILPNLKELEINGDFIPREVEEALKKHKNKPKFTYNKQENQYQEAGNIPEKKDPPRFSLLRKKED